MVVPLDPALPQLPKLLDGVAVGAAFGAMLPGKVHAHARYIRYKPANKAIVLYEIEYGGRQDFAVLSVAALRDLRRVLLRESTLEMIARSRPRCLAADPVFFLEELQALVEWYPANRTIPGLSFEGDYVREALVRCGRRINADREPKVVVYKPERRAILQWGDTYLRVYSREEDFRSARKNAEISCGVAGMLSPRTVFDFPEHRIFVQAELVGQRPEETDENLALIGRSIRHLHDTTLTGLEVFSPGAHFDLARKTAEHVARLLPQLADRARRLVETLGRKLPKPGHSVPSHGDFHSGQLLTCDGHLAFLDFDHMTLADPADDLATYAAHAIGGESDSLSSVCGKLGPLLDGYGTRPDNLDWYLASAILRRAGFPFRLLEPDWPSGTERLLRAAEAHLG